MGACIWGRINCTRAYRRTKVWRTILSAVYTHSTGTLHAYYYVCKYEYVQLYIHFCTRQVVVRKLSLYFYIAKNVLFSLNFKFTIFFQTIKVKSPKIHTFWVLCKQRFVSFFYILITDKYPKLHSGQMTWKNKNTATVHIYDLGPAGLGFTGGGGNL
jgi:hypothetical protein